MDLRPLSVADVLDYTVEIIWKKFWLFVSASVVVQCPAFFIIDFCTKCLVTCLKEKGIAEIVWSISMIPLLAVIVIFYYFTKGIVSLITQFMILDRPISFLTVLEEAFKMFKSLSGVGIVTMLISCSFVIIPFTLITCVYNEGKLFYQSLFLIGLTSIVILAFWMFLMVKLYFAVSAVTVERRGAFNAIRRSFDLSRGHWLRSCLIWSLANTIILTTGFFSHIFFGISGMLYLIVVFPIATVPETVLFYDIKIREEAYDLELLALKRYQEIENKKDQKINNCSMRRTTREHRE